VFIRYDKLDISAGFTVEGMGGGEEDEVVGYFGDFGV
jgi:hypothetical protein